MILVSLVTVAATLAVVFAIRLLLRRRRPGLFPARLTRRDGRLRTDAPPLGETVVDLPPTLTATQREEPGARQAALTRADWLASPELQAAQLVYQVPERTLTDGEPVGLAVTSRAVGPDGYPQQDVYYVQRDIIALARGLTAPPAAQRAAALSLSGIMTSPLGRTRDAEKALREGVKTANALVRSVARREPQYSDMAATLDVVFVDFRADQPLLHFAHVGNSTIWLWRGAGGPAQQLTEPHAMDGGQVLRAVGLAKDLVPEVGREPVDLGDRVFLATASPYLAVPPKLVETIAAAHADQPLRDCVAALADAIGPAATAEGLTILAAELARPASFAR
jgi:hypothetical protein